MMLLALATPTMGSSFLTYQSGLTSLLGGGSLSTLGTGIQGIAISMVAVAALIGVYEAFFDGGNVRALCVTLFKYALTAFIINNWTPLFTAMINDMANVCGTIVSGAGNSNSSTWGNNSDVYYQFQNSLQTYYQNTGDGLLTQAWNAATGNILMAVLTSICAFFENVAYLFFCLWYTFWGVILWGIGPIIVCLLPSAGLGKYATAYLGKIFEFMLWPLLYVILGAAMVGLQMDTATNITNTAASGNQVQAQMFICLAAVALSICLITIPFTAHALIQGNFVFVGGAMIAFAMKAYKGASSALAPAKGGGGGGGGRGNASNGSSGGAKSGQGGSTMGALGQTTGGGAAHMEANNDSTLPPFTQPK